MRDRITCWLLIIGLIAVGSLPHTGGAQPMAPDACGDHARLIGWSDALNGATFDGLDVGGLSALAWDGRAGSFRALVDNQGSSPARIFTLDIPVNTRALGEPSATGVTRLTTADDEPFTGENSDNEGMMLLRDGDVLIASETEPSIRRYTDTGALIDELPVPRRFLVAPDGNAEGNGSFESLAISPSGQRLYTANESPLATDGRADDRRGRHRILRYVATDTTSFKPDAEFFYATDPDLSVVEIVALTETRLLILERGFSIGPGSTSRLYTASVRAGTDISDSDSLRDTDVAPLEKRLLLDLADCPTNGAPNPGLQLHPLLDNIEAMAFGPVQPNGSRPLVLVSDNNFNDVQITRVYAVALDILARTSGPDGSTRRQR